MKKLFNAFLALAAGLAIAGCAKEYDDSALQDKVNNLDKKVTELEKKVNSLTEEVTGLATTVKQWKEGGFVESVTEIKEGDVVVGYTVKFVGGQTVVLYNGKNGKDGEPGKNGDPGAPGEPGAPGAAGEAGATPTIILYEGNLVWAIGTEPILVDGKPVPANVVPTFAINDEGHLIMTLQGQETDLGKVKGEDGAAGAGGDSILKSIEVSEDGENVVFTLTNDTTYEIPLAKAFKLVIENTQIEASAGKTVEIPFKVENGTAEMVDFFVNNSAYEAKIADSKLVVTVPDPFQAAQILVWAQNDKGLSSLVKLSFIASAELVVVTPADEIEAIPAAAGDFVISLTSNVDLDVKIPEDATWISKAEVTKADYKLTLTLTENETGAPREAEISIVRKDNGQEVKTVKIVQLASTGPVAKKDVLNNAFTGISGTTYTDWADKAGASGAIYAGNSAGDKTSIQLRSDIKNDMYSGVVSTTTGGLVKHIKVTWNTGTSVTRYIDVFGSNTAYTSSADLYDYSKRGTLLGTLAFTQVEANVAELDIEGEYAYIGFRSRKSAQYLDEVVITWEEGTPTPAAEPSYNWDFANSEWQALFAEYGEAGADITGWNIIHDGLQIVSTIDKSKYQDNCFQMGGKANLISPVVVDRYFSFTAPKDGYVLVKASNTGDSADETRKVTVANNGATEDKVAGVSSTNPVNLVYAVKAGNVTVYPTGNGLRFYKIAFSETEPKLQVKRQWGWYSEGANLWTANMTAISITHPDGIGMARGLAMDNEYIYLPKSSGYAAVGAVKISEPTTQVKGNVSTISGGSTFVTSFARMIKNSNAEVNGGKDVLLVCNLTETNSDANKLVVYAYTNGVEAAPVTLAAFCWDSANNVNDWRRYGDRFFVSGSWDEGKLYFPSFNAGKIVVLDVANGARTAVEQYTATTNSPEGIKDLCIYPGDSKLFITNGSVANLVATDGTKTNGWDTLVLDSSSDNGKGTWGYNFFKFNGKDWIAYARIDGNKAWYEIIEDKGDLISSLNAQEGLIKGPIHNVTNLDAEHATGGVADCCVRVINGEVVIAAMTRDGGLVVDKLVFE